jgi:hypothetical protein
MQVNKKKNEDAKKRLSVERIYQKKTQLEHILLRPDTYIGSVELVTQVKTKLFNICPRRNCCILNNYLLENVQFY